MSRLISFLDKDRDIDIDYSNVEFDIELDDNTRINQNNRTYSPVLVKVFNSDFVRKIFGLILTKKYRALNLLLVMLQ